MASILTPEEKKELLSQASDYDFVRFTVSDMNGIPRGKVVPKASVPRMIEDGLAVYSGIVCLGHRTQVPHPKEVEDCRFGNCLMLPARASIIPTPWASSGTNTFGMIPCETLWPGNEPKPQDVSPRYMARKQLRELEGMGYRIYSGAEYEFVLWDQATKKPVFDGLDAIIDSIFMEQEPLLTEIYQNLSKSGVEIESIHSEYGRGQFELSTKAMFDLDTAEGNVLLKECVKELARKRGLEATFMTHPDDECNNGTHLSHSLWNKDGLCMFDNLQDDTCPLLSHWLGGLIQHGAAIVAFCFPTVNCYRRLGCDFCPSKIDWAFEDRATAFRVKVTADQKKCYVENRLPAGSSVGYLVLAATIAAGIDGIRNKIPPPKPADPEAKVLPSNLEEALKALEDDCVMVAAFGETFVRWYCELRRQADLTTLKDSDVTKADADALERERVQYFKFA